MEDRSLRVPRLKPSLIVRVCRSRALGLASAYDQRATGRRVVCSRYGNFWAMEVDCSQTIASAAVSPPSRLFARPISDSALSASDLRRVAGPDRHLQQPLGANPSEVFISHELSVLRPSNGSAILLRAGNRPADLAPSSYQQPARPPGRHPVPTDLRVPSRHCTWRRPPLHWRPPPEPPGQRRITTCTTDT